MTKNIDALWIALALASVGMVAGCHSSNDPQASIASARDYRQKNDYKAAIIELKNALQANPENAEARYLLGVTYNDVGDFSSAAQELRRARDLHYDQGKTLAALGQSLLMSGQLQQVLDEIKLDGDAKNPAFAEVMTLRGLALIGLGQVPAGSDLLDQALAAQPDYANALAAKARLAAGANKLDEAQRLIEHALASDPTNREALLIKGGLAQLSGDKAGAVAAYQKVLASNPNDLRAHTNLVSLQILSGDMTAARKQIDELSKAAPGNPVSYYMRAVVELKERNYTAAKNDVDQVLRVAPDHLPTLLLAGTVESALGLHSQAQAHLARVLGAAPGNLFAREQLISSYAKSGQLDKAMETLQPGLAQAPQDSSLMILAGEVYMQQGEYQKAEQFFANASKQNPNDAGARTKLGMSRLAIGETQQALSDLESATQLKTDDYTAEVLLVMYHLRQSRYDQALEAVQALETKQPKNPLTYNLKAEVYIGKKDNANARKNLEYALTLQPNYLPAAITLARLDLQDNNRKAARDRLEAIVAKEPSNAQALVALANLAAALGATRQEQIDWLEQARKAAPRLIQPQLMLSEAYSKSNDWKKALEVAEQAQATNPDDPQVLANLGAVQIGAGKKQEGLLTFQKLVTLQPKSATALQQLAAAQAAAGDKSAAIATLKKALALNPDLAAAKVGLVQLQMSAGNYTEAMSLAEQLQKPSASSQAGYVLEGDISMAQQKFPAAVKAYETAYSLGKNTELAIKLHNAYTSAGKLPEAQALLAQLLNDNPNDALVRLYAADINLKSGKYKEAIDHYEWLQQKQPDNVVVLNNLAWAYHQVKDKRAQATAERAYKLRPDNAAVIETLGSILIDAGDMNHGLDLLQKAAAAAPSSPDIRFSLAQGFIKAGDKAKARVELQRLLATNADFPRRTEATKALKDLGN